MYLDQKRQKILTLYLFIKSRDWVHFNLNGMNCFSRSSKNFGGRCRNAETSVKPKKRKRKRKRKKTKQAIFISISRRGFNTNRNAKWSDRRSLYRERERENKKESLHTHRKRTLLTIPDEMSKNGNWNREIKSTSWSRL